MRTLLVALALATLPGCFLDRSQTNLPIEPAAVARLRPGESTADDVTRLLGAPVEVVQLGRRSAWRYEHQHLKRAGLFLLLVGFRGTDSQADRVWVFLDADDRVTHVASTFAAEEAEYALPGFTSAREAGNTGDGE